MTEYIVCHEGVLFSRREDGTPSYYLEDTVERIAGQDLIPGKHLQGYFPAEGTDIQIPYNILCGTAPGPLVVITAGIHNAEYPGIQAAIELAAEIDPDKIRGNIAILPLANRTGFEHRTMSLVYEDQKNLNRVFPGNPDGTASERLAQTLFHEFIRRADAYIDLHSGDGYETLTPYVYYVGETPGEKTAREMASCVNAAWRVRSRCFTGGAYNTASVHGVPAILLERGQMGLLTRADVEADKADVLNVLRYLKVLPGEAAFYLQKELREYDNEAPATGCWYPEKQAGAQVKRGEKIGEIRDYFGQCLFTEYAPADAVLLYQCSSLNIIEHGSMTAYGVEIQPSE